MDFIGPLHNSDQAPQLDQSGKLNLGDWKNVTSQNSLFRDTVTLPSTVKIKVSQVPNMPSPEILALSDEDLMYVANQGAFPEVWCLLFLRGMTEEVRAIAPMLAVPAFYDQYKDEISEKLRANLSSDASGEWIEYYAGCLYETPIFKVALYLIEESDRELIALEYLSQFNDMKYLSQEQISALTIEQKVSIISTTFVESRNDPAKRNNVLRLLTEDDVLDADTAASILGLAHDSLSAGALMSCPPFYNDYNNAYNTVVTWIRHCVAEKIGTNQSVWYKQAQAIELQHGFSLSGTYVKNTQGQPIGGVDFAGSFSDMQMVKQPGNFGKPIGL